MVAYVGRPDSHPIWPTSWWLGLATAAQSEEISTAWREGPRPRRLAGDTLTVKSLPGITRHTREALARLVADDGQ